MKTSFKALPTGIVCKEVGNRVVVESMDEFMLKADYMNWWEQALKIIKEL